MSVRVVEGMTDVRVCREGAHKRVVEDADKRVVEGAEKRVVEGADPYRFDHARTCREDVHKRVVAGADPYPFTLSSRSSR